MRLGADLGIIGGLEEQLFDRHVRSSPDSVAARLADDFLEIGRSGGVFAKDEVVRSLAAEGEDEPSSLRAYDYELRTLAEDVVLLTYRTVRVRQGAGPIHTVRSSIWKLIEGRWRMTFHQGTPTPSSL